MAREFTIVMAVTWKWRVMLRNRKSLSARKIRIMRTTRRIEIEFAKAEELLMAPLAIMLMMDRMAM